MKRFSGSAIVIDVVSEPTVMGVCCSANFNCTGLLTPVIIKSLGSTSDVLTKDGLINCAAEFHTLLFSMMRVEISLSISYTSMSNPFLRTTWLYPSPVVKGIIEALRTAPTV